MEISPVAVERWTDFLKTFYHKKIGELALEYPDKTSLEIDFHDLDKNDIVSGDALLESPDMVLPEINTALREYDLCFQKNLDAAEIRVVKLPVTSKIPIRAVRGHHVDDLIAIEGLIKKVTDVRPEYIEATFKCNLCEKEFFEEQLHPIEFTEPKICPSCDRRGPFTLLTDKSIITDSQKARIQESPEGLRGGEQPRDIDITLKGDLAGRITPGNRVIINGILRSYQRKTKRGNKTKTLEFILEAHSIETLEQEYEDIEITADDLEEIERLAAKPSIYADIIESIAPSIYGYQHIKEALSLQLFGGVTKQVPDGTRLRGDIHILLIGDPGIAKSQLLRYIGHTAPRAIYTSGKGSSAAGLTATAVKDEFDGRWSLEAGALVLADKGIACVDEIDKMRPEDRGAMHEAMEQQTVTVTKAGINARLQSRCSVLAAANPKRGRFDARDDIAEQINMEPALLSRFDLIFILRDETDKYRDEQIADHIITTHRVGEEITAHNNRIDTRHIQPPIDPEMLRKYIAYTKTVIPILTLDAMNSIKQFYVEFRNPGDPKKNTIPLTARSLEALIRLAEGSARIRLSHTVTREDAERAIRITRQCIKDLCYNEENGVFDVDKIEVGVTADQRAKIRTLRDIIRAIGEKTWGVAAVDKVIEKARDHGITADETQLLIKKLKQQGDLFTPKEGHIRLTG